MKSNKERWISAAESRAREQGRGRTAFDRLIFREQACAARIRAARELEALRREELEAKNEWKKGAKAARKMERLADLAMEGVAASIRSKQQCAS